MKNLIFFVAFICQLVCGAKYQYPNYLKAFICKKSDPDYNRCLLEEFKKITPYYVKGVPELGVESIDPYVVPFYSINATVMGLGQFKVDFKDGVVKGLGDIIFHSVKADLEANSIEISATLPRLDIDTKLNVAGKLFSNPINVPLHFNGNITDVQVLFRSNAEKVKKNGKEFFQISKIATKVSIGDGNIRLDTPNKNAEEMVKSIESVFNENPRDAFNMMSPVVLEYAQDFMKKIFNQWISTLSVSEWLPESK